MLRKLFSFGIVLILCLIFSTNAFGFDVKEIPGSTWNQITLETNGLTRGLSTIGYINQGIDWGTLPGDITFNTFGEFRYRLRSRKQKYYNAYGPAIGVEFKKSVFRLGTDYYWEQFPEQREESNKLQFYLSGYYDWNLEKIGITKPFNIKSFPGSTWGNITQDVDGLTRGLSAIGYINQGIDWITLPGDITFNTFAEFRYRLRSRKQQYYNAYGPAVGVEFKKSAFRLGADYNWERFPSQNKESNKFQVYLTWYFDWSFLKK